MNIGEKIKDIRCAKMMTQQELAGEFITRNMLSRIENGFALPSIPTLVYIAERLGVPPGYLLADESEEFHYRKTAGMPDIKSAFAAGDWEICRDLCDNLDGADDETKYVAALCVYNEAKDHFNAGNLRRAAELFDLFKSDGEDLIYPIDNLMGESDTYLMCIASISTSLVADIETANAPSARSLADAFCRYFLRLINIENGDNSQVWESLSDDVDFVIYESHLNAKLKMKSGRYSDAYHILKKLLSSDHTIPAPVLYFIFTDLEVCCRELSDYRGAYEYSSDRTGMFEKFLG